MACFFQKNSLGLSFTQATLQNFKMKNLQTKNHQLVYPKQFASFLFCLVFIIIIPFDKNLGCLPFKNKIVCLPFQPCCCVSWSKIRMHYKNPSPLLVYFCRIILSPGCVFLTYNNTTLS